MSQLIISDLHITTELDTAGMRQVRGGHSTMMRYQTLPGFGESKHDFTFTAEQLTSQTQENVNENGNNVAFASGIQSTFKPSQSSSNSIRF